MGAVSKIGDFDRTSTLHASHSQLCLLDQNSKLHTPHSKKRRSVPLNIKKAAAAALAAITICACVSGCNFIRSLSRNQRVATADTPSRMLETKNKAEREKSFSGYGYDSLSTDRLKELYADIDDMVSTLSVEDVWYHDGTTLRQFDEALEAYLNDHPGIFWINETSRYSYYEDGDDLMLEMSFTLKNDELAQAKKKLDKAVEQIKEKAPENADDFEMELFINDYIVDNCDYDQSSTMRHNAYGALVDGNAVCDGYSRAFQLLCGELGIDSVVIEGDSDEFDSQTETDSDSNDVGHMWNCVKLDGDWYHVDVTWNDVGNLEEVYTDTERYFYLNLTTEQIERDHIISPKFSEITAYDNTAYYNSYVPECDSTELNYFKRSCVTVTDLDDSSALVTALADAAVKNDGYFDFLIGDDLDFEDTLDSVVDSYAYNWITQANDINYDGPQIDTQGHVYAYKNMRIMTFILNYK